jgi:hypothetical protein
MASGYWMMSKRGARLMLTAALEAAVDAYGPGWQMNTTGRAGHGADAGQEFLGAGVLEKEARWPPARSACITRAVPRNDLPQIAVAPRSDGPSGCAGETCRHKRVMMRSPWRNVSSGRYACVMARPMRGSVAGSG